MVSRISSITLGDRASSEMGLEELRVPLYIDTLRYEEEVHRKFRKEAVIRWYIARTEDTEAIIEVVCRRSKKTSQEVEGLKNLGVEPKRFLEEDFGRSCGKMVRKKSIGCDEHSKTADR